MSNVTDVILTAPLGSKEDDRGEVVYPAISEINSWLEQRGFGQLNSVSDAAGGRKAMQCGVWLGAFNHFDVPAFYAVARAAKWEYPEDIQCFVKAEDEERFRIVV